MNKILTCFLSCIFVLGIGAAEAAPAEALPERTPLADSTAPSRTAAPAKTFAFKISPQHLTINGLHADLEKQLLNKQQSLTLAPRFYKGSTYLLDAFAKEEVKKTFLGASEVSGSGLELMHRFYLFSPSPLNGFYLSYGANYHYFALTYSQNGWAEVLYPNGLYYLEFKPVQKKEYINRLGLTAYAGYQITNADQPVLIDFYIGAGGKKSFSSAENPLFNRTKLDFGYSGFYTTAGVKIGILLR